MRSPSRRCVTRWPACGSCRQSSCWPGDSARFPCLRLAYEALAAGGTAPAILNAANEVAVEAFLGGRLPFIGIPRVVEETLSSLAAAPADELEAVIAADGQARRIARDRMANLLGRAA